MRNVLDKSCRENQNTHFIFNNFFPKILPFMSNVEKFGGARRATNVTKWRICIECWVSKHTRACSHPSYQRDVTRAHARVQIGNTYCFFAATVVTRTRLNVTLYVHCLSCSCAQSGDCKHTVSLSWILGEFRTYICYE
jgi:hypothetical protein